MYAHIYLYNFINFSLDGKVLWTAIEKLDPVIITGIYIYIYIYMILLYTYIYIDMIYVSINIINTYINMIGLPRGNWAEKQKRAWTSRELGPHVKVITCPSKDKFLHCIEPGSLLIDDRVVTRESWENAGM
jgi:hypothetical protein